MAAYAYWFILALILLGVEMMTGTFYILVLALASALGGLAALAGANFVWQYLLAGIAAIVGTLILRRSRAVRRADPSQDNLDIGQPVRVLAWNADGTARVHYRGAEWDAQPEEASASREGTFYIKAIQGSKLILTQQQP
jgi:membrane protein implicated in regulation of membrane protease activity